MQHRKEMTCMPEGIKWQHIGNIRGPKGDTGAGLTIIDYFATPTELANTITNPSVGDAYGVGSEGAYQIYTYSATKGWVNSGSLQPDINEQAPNYAEATTLTNLTSGEKISIAFGKIKKAIKEFISHNDNTTNHITADERTAWNGKAPGGKGLGVIADGTRDIPFSQFLKNGGGFYQVRTTEDAPISTNKWFGLLQVSRSVEETSGTGVQLAFDDNDVTKPRMWLRSILGGVSGNWVETLHTGNIAEHYAHSPIEVYQYRGNGVCGEVNKKSYTFSREPKLIILFGIHETGRSQVIAPHGASYATTYGANDIVKNIHFTWDGNTVSWHSTYDATSHKNENDKWYYCIAVF